MTNSDLLCMIPGPVEFHEEVLKAMSTKATSHVDPKFIESFGQCLELMRDIFITKSAQPFIISGAGVLSWDIVATNFVQSNQKCLVLTTGLFGSRFAECLKVYGADVTELKADIGMAPDMIKLEQELDKGYSMITITQVDTSTGVLSDVKSITKLVKSKSPFTLVVVDGVCSIGAEEFYMDEWLIDVAVTGSQKALGTPPGLCLMMVGQNAMKVLKERTELIKMYYCNLNYWLPIMISYEERKPSYFSTPAVQCVFAFNKSLKLIKEKGIENVFKQHKETSRFFKDEIEKLGLKLVPQNREVAANTMTAIYYPDSVLGLDVLKNANKEGVLFAGGLHPEIGAKYFRVGHMGISSTERTRGHIEKSLEAIKSSLKACGFKI